MCISSLSLSIQDQLDLVKYRNENPFPERRNLSFPFEVYWKHGLYSILALKEIFWMVSIKYANEKYLFDNLFNYLIKLFLQF